MRFSTIKKQLNKLGYASFDELIAIIDNPSEVKKAQNTKNIIVFTRYILIHNKRHEASSIAAKKRESAYIEEQNKLRAERQAKYDAERK
jgi:hypothetical protein